MTLNGYFQFLNQLQNSLRNRTSRRRRPRVRSRLVYTSEGLEDRTLLSAAALIAPLETTGDPNHAPVLNPAGNPALPPIVPGTPNNGAPIGGLIESMKPAGGITDVDPGAKRGIAIIGANNTNGNWQFTTDGGTTWTDLGTVNATTARLLSAEPGNGVRFVPKANFIGDAGICFVAWDQTTGTNGSTADTSLHGGSTAFSDAKEIATVRIKADPSVNHAPILNPAGDPALPPVVPGTENKGAPIAGIIESMKPKGGIFDVDEGAKLGIAVIGANNEHGKWQFSTDDGSSWTDLGTVNPTSARLLSAGPGNRLRFVPNDGFIGASGICFVAWDQTTGTNGGTADVTLGHGGSTAFSDAKEQAFVAVKADPSVNHAPILNPAGDPGLPPVVPGEANNGVPVGGLIESMKPKGGIIDVDAGAKLGIAIIGANNEHGKWQYSIDDGTTWSDVGTVSGTAARLLSAGPGNRIRFLPNADFVGAAGIGFIAWDQTTGTNGGTADTSVHGGSSAFSEAKDYAFVGVKPDPNVNHAPILNPAGEPKLPPVQEGAPNNGGTIAGLIASMGPQGGIKDIDEGAKLGIAIIGADGKNGKWQFSTDDGATWTDLGETGPNKARLLAAADGTRLRFLPKPGFFGTAGICFVAWDQTTGANGATADVTLGHGGSTAFSDAKEQALVKVNPDPNVNHAPMLNPAGAPALPTVKQGADNIGGAISGLINSMKPLGGIFDVDQGAKQGVAIIGANSEHGTWQYTIDGGTTWTDLGTVSGTSARLLASTGDSTRVRFVPAAGFTGQAAIAFIAWDQTTGTNGDVADVSVHGGSTAFSNDKDYAFVNVIA
ncbi:MAG: hypothetical protein U0903_08610 [Planctomycetales bacterium]